MMIAGPAALDELLLAGLLFVVTGLVELEPVGVEPGELPAVDRTATVDFWVGVELVVDAEPGPEVEDELWCAGAGFDFGCGAGPGFGAGEAFLTVTDSLVALLPPPDAVAVAPTVYEPFLSFDTFQLALHEVAFAQVFRVAPLMVSLMLLMLPADVLALALVATPVPLTLALDLGAVRLTAGVGGVVVQFISANVAP
jgi:hypothetical protein